MLTITLTIPGINQITSGINWSASSRDLVIALIFVLSVLIHVFALKRDKILALLFGIYVSYLLVLFFPYNLWLSHLSLEQMVWLKVSGFVLLIIILAVIFSRSHIFTNLPVGIITHFFQAVIFSILNVGLLLSLLSSLLPIKILGQFSNFSQNIFTIELTRFVWVIVPLVVILFSIKIKKRGPGRPPADY